MKKGIETVRGIRYKLRMMGVKLSGPTYVYGNNMSVIHNKYPTTRFDIEEEVKLYLLPCHQRISGYGREF